MTETDEHDPIEEAEERAPMAAWKKGLVVFALVAGVFGWFTMARAEEAAQQDAERMAALHEQIARMTEAGGAPPES